MGRFEQPCWLPNGPTALQGTARITFMPEQTIRAAYSDHIIRIYQAYRPEIAIPILEAGRFVPPFQMRRTTWIKPSFNWMMYRSGYASKAGQEVVLGIDIKRDGFEWALEHAVLSKFTPSIHSSHNEWQRLLAEKPVRVQWDPERDWRLNIIEGVRTIQIGLTGDTINRYVSAWIVSIENITDLAHTLRLDLASGRIPEHLPDRLEKVYPLNAALRRTLCAQ
jgi:hypothetical protein